MTGDQMRAARALLGMSTRDLAEALKCSAMTISKLERGQISSKTSHLWIEACSYFHGRGLAFYAGGVIRTYDRLIQEYGSALRARFSDGKHGSVYVMALDAIIERASQGGEG